MAWLLSEARVLASIEVADSHADKLKGLLGRDHLDGALALPGCKWVHTIGMRFPIDVAYVAADNTVIKAHTLARHRVGPPIRHAVMIIEAEAGAFERWGLKVGDPVEIRESTHESPVERSA